MTLGISYCYLSTYQLLHCYLSPEMNSPATSCITCLICYPQLQRPSSKSLQSSHAPRRTVLFYAKLPNEKLLPSHENYSY